MIWNKPYNKVSWTISRDFKSEVSNITLHISCTKPNFSVGFDTYLWVMNCFFTALSRLTSAHPASSPMGTGSSILGVGDVCYLLVLSVHKMYSGFTIRLPRSLCLCTDETSAYLIGLHCSGIVINEFIVAYSPNPHTLHTLCSVCWYDSLIRSGKLLSIRKEAIIPHFKVLFWGKPRKFLIRIFGVLAEIRTGITLNTSLIQFV